jgi:hypothetical protein
LLFPLSIARESVALRKFKSNMFKTFFISIFLIFIQQQLLAQLFTPNKKEQIQELSLRVDSLFRANDSLKTHILTQDSVSLLVSAQKNQLAQQLETIEAVQASLRNELITRYSDSIQQLTASVNRLRFNIDSLNFINSLVVDCEETSEEIPGKKFERLFKTCSFKNHRTMSIGEPDYKGRYSYKYKLYKLLNDSSVVITNAEFIKETRRDEFIAILNVRIADEAKKVVQMAQEEKSKCFDGFVFKSYTYEELGIQFNEGMVEFTVPFGLPNACMPYDGVLIAFPLKEMVPYFSE